MAAAPRTTSPVLPGEFWQYLGPGFRADLAEYEVKNEFWDGEVELGNEMCDSFCQAWMAERGIEYRPQCSLGCPALVVTGPSVRQVVLLGVPTVRPSDSVRGLLFASPGVAEKWVNAARWAGVVQDQGGFWIAARNRRWLMQGAEDSGTRPVYVRIHAQ